MKLAILPLLFITAFAHPLGNFSVSHLARLSVSKNGVSVTYVLDLAEVPTYEMLRDWKLNAKSPVSELQAMAEQQTRSWMSGLEFRRDGQRVDPTLERTSIELKNAEGGLRTMRVTSALRIDCDPGSIEFADHNFPDRSGWKEIVIDASQGAEIVQASQGSTDPTALLTKYPTESGPQDLRASIQWRAGSGGVAKIVPIEQPPPVPVPSESSVSTASPARNDYLSELLNKKEIGPGLLLLGIAVAFGLGAVHALSPGHGKTIVAAYLVGSRGTMGHAAFLGAMVTFTHTISVFALGLATLFLSRYLVPEKIVPVLGAISGISIVAVGASLFLKRLRKLRHDHAHAHGHHHHHHHHHDHGHAHTHSHVPEGEVSMGSLIALGASGGLVPCPTALVLLLSSIALGHVGIGLILLVAFSLGLAGVLMAIGMMVLYAKNWLPDPQSASRHPVFRLVPVLSAFVIVCLGVAMTWMSVVQG